MALAQGDLEEIGRYVREHIPEWMGEQGRVSLIREFDLRERIVRVEEELKHQRELMEQGFALMEKRFDQVDKRFEQTDKRFESMDHRFATLNQRMDRFMVWSFGLAISATGILLAAIKYLH
jgi:hypothetical protein